MKVSVIIPAFNEEGSIPRLLDALYDARLPVEREVVLVDNGSARPIEAFIGHHRHRPGFNLVRLERNVGKGGAIKVGMRVARGDAVVVQDADLEYHPRDLPALLAPMMNEGARVVYGSRLLGRTNRMHFLHHAANKFLTATCNALFKLQLTDMETGYKLFSRDVLDRLHVEATEFEFETEVTCKLAMAGINIIEVPISYATRVDGLSKVSVGDGVETLLLLVRMRFFPRSRAASVFYELYKHHVKKAVNWLKHAGFWWIKR